MCHLSLHHAPKLSPEHVYETVDDAVEAFRADRAAAGA